MSQPEITNAASPLASAARLSPAVAGDAEVSPWRTPIELTLLGAVWGGSFLFMRVAAGDFGFIPLV